MSLSSNCLIYDGAPSQRYARVKVDGRSVAVHRLAWERVHGPIPRGLNVLHHCDNTKCYEITHLFLGTQADNMADCKAKGRYAHVGPKGERHGMAKLTESVVRRIRQHAAEGKRQADIALIYGVTLDTVNRIVRRNTWRHLNG